MNGRLFILSVTFFIVFAGIVNITFSQTEQLLSKNIPPQLLQNDFSLLRETLEKNHPGIYRYSTKLQMDRVFDSCMASITNPMPLDKFYALISFTIAAMKDGHSNCRLPKQALSDFASNSMVFPAMVIFINNRAYIFCCKQDSALSGVELLTINNRPMDEIIQKLFSYIPSDAGIKSRINWELPEYFHLFYNSIYGVQQHFEIGYRSSDGKIRKATLQPDIIKNIFCRNPFPAPKKYLELFYYPGNIAVLQIKTFFDGFLQQTGENFHSFLDSVFTDLTKKHTKKLLIDLRRNQGGNDGNGALLYSYITQKTFSYYASLETVHEKFTAEHHALLNIQLPQRNSFAGKVYILQDGRSFSASAEFAAVAKSNNRAFFLGEENGGGYYGNTSGDDLTLLLPNSQISCRIPLVKYTVSVRKLTTNGRGILPDQAIYPKIGDIISGQDRESDQVLRFVQSH